MKTETDVATFLAISREVFAPIYPYYAARFLEQTGIRTGVCLDLGCGGGDLGLAVAGQSDLRAVLYDKSDGMLRGAGENAANRGLADRCALVAGDVHALPFADGFADLVVSRGSLMFWDDLPRAFAEVGRVLAPGGRAILGGGLGPPEVRETICKEMARRDPRWSQGIPPPRPGTDPDRHAVALRAAGIDHFTITREDTGHWIEITGGAKRR